MQLCDYQLSDCLTRRLARDAAYMTCRMEVDASYQGTPLPRVMRVTWVWSRVKGRWLVRFEQATVVAAAEARSGD
jgi:ketosteroid isomerase-like protein